MRVDEEVADHIAAARLPAESDDDVVRWLLRAATDQRPADACVIRNLPQPLR